MTPGDFRFFQELLKKQAGLALSFDKSYLLATRLAPIASTHGLRTMSDMADALRSAKNPEIEDAVVEAMMTGETSFFRDVAPFECLRQHVLPSLIKARKDKKALRVWSAGCSTGQEAYSLAIILKECGHDISGWKVEIVATDLSKAAVEQARSGIYSQFDVQRGMPAKYLVRHFTQFGNMWHVKTETKAAVSFRPLNLLGDTSAFGSFDIILCRNVLSTLDMAAREKVLLTLHERLEPDGALMLGASEGSIASGHHFKPYPRIPGIFVRDDSTFAAA